jgi:F0F1-type ATP synthase delta subunit
MRIRTDNKPYRQDIIDRVANHYDCNKTDALMNAAEDVPELHQAVQDVLSRDDLTAQQKREIAARFSETRGMDVEITETVDVELG